MSEDTIDVCPECDSTDLYQRQPSIQATDHSDATYRCRTCHADIDEPRQRPRQQAGSQKGLSKRLRDADPEEVFGGDECRECGTDLGAGYLCDDCDTVEGWPDG